MKEPRIHFAINCASFSCPRLAKEAYNSSSLEKQLQQASLAFINDVSKNKIEAHKIEISYIFKWFKKDFTQNQSLIAFLNQYASTKIDENAAVSFLEYNWELNM